MKPDRQLGMDRDITRRDLIHGAGLAALGMGLAGGSSAGPAIARLQAGDSRYPPTLSGLRGSHPAPSKWLTPWRPNGRRSAAPRTSASSTTWWWSVAASAGHCQLERQAATAGHEEQHTQLSWAPIPT